MAHELYTRTNQKIYFAGLSLEQVADHLHLTRRTIDRDWCFARAFLKAELDLDEAG